MEFFIRLNDLILKQIIVWEVKKSCISTDSEGLNNYFIIIT